MNRMEFVEFWKITPIFFAQRKGLILNSRNLGVGKEQCSSCCIFRSSREGYWRKKKKKSKAEAGMATAKFQREVAAQIWGRDKQGSRCAGQGHGARDLGQKRRGRDVQLVSRPALKGLASRHGFEVVTWDGLLELQPKKFGL